MSLFVKPQSYNVSEKYCNQHIQNVPTATKFVTNVSLIAAPVSTISNATLTTMVATTIDNHTVVFAGSSDGRLIKVI